MECGEKKVPADESAEGVSQPRARELPGGAWRCAKVSMDCGVKRDGVADCDNGVVVLRMAAANRRRSGTFEKRPA